MRKIHLCLLKILQKEPLDERLSFMNDAKGKKTFFLFLFLFFFGPDSALKWAKWTWQILIVPYSHGDSAKR